MYNFNYAGNILDRVLIDAGRLCGNRGRANHAAVQHSRNPDILHVGELRRELRGQVNARNGFAHGLIVHVILGRNIGRQFQTPAVARGGNLHVKVLAAKQTGEGDLMAIVHDADHAIGDGELRDGRAETLGGQLQ